jgi:hypothetical protein
MKTLIVTFCILALDLFEKVEAEVLCQNSKTLVVRAFVARRCPLGYWLILDTKLFKGAKGDTGSQGPAGPKGERGFSAFDPIPPGTTVYGVIGAQGSVPADQSSAFMSAWASLPGIPPTPLKGSDILLVDMPLACLYSCSYSGGADTNVCTGYPDRPMAPPGKVCIYPSLATNAWNLHSYPSGYVMTDQPFYGFAVQWTAHLGGRDQYFGWDTNPNATYFEAVWAYTAPYEAQ